MNLKSILLLTLAALLMAAGCGKHDVYVSSSAAGGEPPAKQETNRNIASNNSESKSPKVVAGNEAFKVYEPAEGTVVGTSFVVKGQARVFEAAFGYSFEDGHNVLAEGNVMADQGAPEWGDFEFTVTLSRAPTSPTGVLTIYESSAKDGSHIHKLSLAYTFEDGLMKLDN
ncbi:Gmad2 immunoglobulin-like domain-containing protein [Paenibacillus lignilyticus]|uniref:Gmad2 immunoglobulin-like domain-containing protein n=1 Tax=Paenibacillus lignilyticus TaxID=1172615 RepID=A0ABS5CGF7_9BACL|nr:Gmad2 immunoglobulin-like domain-containing protein [Paenibacillus lignilyticus]MBP3964928.1 Gmad2 immunoglobulin-like domain-containing protein [Paenibacillus lignilyticus]